MGSHFISVEVLDCTLHTRTSAIPEFGVRVLFAEKQVENVLTFRTSFFYPIIQP